jgi:2-dehydro-3-deoxyphosphogluconate aldolase/(4S)-4-hydroxy-2-oxoglutarate aldolase
LEISLTATAPERPPRQTYLAELFREARVIPVITIENVGHAIPLARALVAGGLRCLEITLRTSAAPAAVEAIAENIPEAIVGVGTVLTPDDLARARALGAHFALSPGAVPELLDAAAADELPFVPGVATPSELMAALARGFDILKFFPAAPLGGIAAMRALGGPFPHVRFCPTGGIGEADLPQWLALPNVIAVGGSWLTPLGDVRAGDWNALTERARRARAAVGK